MRFRRAFCTTALLSLTATVALAQYTVKNIVFDGVTPYTQSALEAASGIKPGTAISKESLQQATQRLSDTGAFDNLQATVDGPFKSVTVIFKVKSIDASKTLAIDFENFIWWQPGELTTELKQRVPLFSNSIPEAGTLQQSIQDALTQMLAEKQIAAKISFRVTDVKPGQPLRIVHYRVDSPDIRLNAFKIDNSLPSLAPETNKLLATLVGSPYDEGTDGKNMTRTVLNLYRDAGYLDATFDRLDRAIASPAADKMNVDLSGSIKSGDLYHIAKMIWAGSPQISEQEFTDANKLKLGDLASQKELSSALTLIDTAYRRQGYMDVTVDAAPQLDSVAHMVTYTITANSGPQYHFSELHILNLAPDARSKFDTLWKLQPGEIYDETYLATFLKANIAQPYLQPYSLTYRVESDPDNHLVKLYLIFAQAAK
jgi:outer membrane protein insertion porin family